MPFTSLALVLLVEDTPPPDSCENYAAQLFGKRGGHLTVHLAVPVPTLPSASVAPMISALVEQSVDDRRRQAAEIASRLEITARLGGFTLEPRLIVDESLAMAEKAASVARLSELVVAPRPSTRGERSVVETVLFGSGRPVLLVPPAHNAPPDFGRIIVAWDGSARAARAVGDAMPLLSRAEHIDIVCVVPSPDKSIAGGELATYLARHCRKVSLSEVAPDAGDAARALMGHATMARAGLIVMGAYAHSRMWQRVLGGVTREVLDGASLPVLMSY